MSTPKISVIVPVYNAEKFLRRCIDSVLSQTYKDFELLLINDGSIDASGDICDEYAKRDARIRVFTSRMAVPVLLATWDLIMLVVTGLHFVILMITHCPIGWLIMK